MDGVGQMWMGLVRCGWGWSNVDGVGYFSSGVDNFCFEVMGTEGKDPLNRLSNPVTGVDRAVQNT